MPVALALAPEPVAVLLPVAEPVAVAEAVDEESVAVPVAEDVAVDDEEPVPFTWLAPVATDDEPDETLASEAVEVRVVLRVGAAVPVDEVEVALVAVEAAEEEEEEEVDELSVMLNWFCWVGFTSA